MSFYAAANGSIQFNSCLDEKTIKAIEKELQKSQFAISLLTATILEMMKSKKSSTWLAALLKLNKERSNTLEKTVPTGGLFSKAAVGKCNTEQ